MKHTPGKWETAGDFADGIWVTAEDGLLVICRLDSAMDSDINENTDRANANLIASAPEMLNALKMILDYHDRDKDNETDLHFENARDVIANAGGE